MVQLSIFYFTLFVIGLAVGDFDPEDGSGCRIYGFDICVHPRSEWAVTPYHMVANRNRRWPLGKIPFVIDPELDDGVKRNITLAMQHYMNRTCIKFVPRTNEPNWLSIRNDKQNPEFCYGYIGMTERAREGQPLVIANPFCHWFTVLLHEFGHVLGLYHEEYRTDRDDNIQMLLNNMRKREGREGNRPSVYDTDLTLKVAVLGDYAYPYDYDSVMQAPMYFGSKEPGVLNTMIGTQGQTWGAKHELSASDVHRINVEYGCSKSSKTMT